MEKVPYQNVREAARSTGVPEYFLRRLVRSGKCPGFQTGRVFKVNVPALLEQLERLSLQDDKGAGP